MYGVGETQNDNQGEKGRATEQGPQTVEYILLLVREIDLQLIWLGKQISGTHTDPMFSGE